MEGEGRRIEEGEEERWLETIHNNCTSFRFRMPTYSSGSVLPLGKNLRVGNPRTPNRLPNAFSASASTFAIRTSSLLSNAWPTSSQAGASLLQWPHPGRGKLSACDHENQQPNQRKLQPNFSLVMVKQTSASHHQDKVYEFPLGQQLIKCLTTFLPGLCFHRLRVGYQGLPYFF